MIEPSKKSRRGGVSIGDTVRLMVRLWKHLSRLRHRHLNRLLTLTLLSAFAEVLTLGAVIAFIGVLMSPVTDLRPQALGAAPFDQLMVASFDGRDGIQAQLASSSVPGGRAFWL